MINRISEIPFWGPEEQIRKFINQHDAPNDDGTFADEKTQQIITQQRIANLDFIFQKQLIWSYGRPKVDDAYFYQDWCPIGTDNIDDGEDVSSDPKWQMELWGESSVNKARDIDRTFNWREFQGYTNSRSKDEMVEKYGADSDYHAENSDDNADPVTLDINTLRHNIMKSYLEVSEWLGDGALQYGSHNGYVSRKMSLAWLFNAVKALINWKLENRDKWAEVDIHPLDLNHKECFLPKGQTSACEVPIGDGDGEYSDEKDLDQKSGICALQTKERSANPQHNGVLKVRGNEFHYGERAYFWTHTSFVGECRFFHNARFLGQTTFDKEINGTAMRSRWADLAEFKEADKEYTPGTLVMFGGEKEITLSRNGKANAIVTTKPGLVLNGDNYPGKTMVGIALTGTVPVRVVERVKKFDKLVASKKYPGCARTRRWYEFWRKPIAIALESWPAGGLVNCITKLEF